MRFLTLILLLALSAYATVEHEHTAEVSVDSGDVTSWVEEHCAFEVDDVAQWAERNCSV
jgi:hypothetical protein